MIPDKLALTSDLLLKDIRKYPFDGISARSKRLKISNRKCGEAIESLAACKLLCKVDIKEKSGRRLLFELSDSIQSLGGIEHRFWNHHIAELNKSKGYNVEIEKKIEGDGFIDQVIISGNDNNIAIEIETGKSHPIETIKRDIELGFSKVICVATNDKAYEFIYDKLSTENLLNNPQVSFILAANYK